jgi:hypothetical protein
MSRLARLFASIVFVLAAVAPVLAQTDELQLLVRRNIGYGAGSQIQGSFRMQATGPADLASVTFKIDEQVVATVTAAPFQVDFNTDSYALGSHTLVAEGQTASGRQLASAPSVFEFVSAAVGWQAAGRLALPILGVLGVLVVIAVGASLLDMRRSRRSPVPLGAPRRYGLLGGAICPKCGRPFSRHWWALNAGVGKLDRCPQCGRWGVVRALPLEQLRAAEAAELDQAKAVTPELSAEEKLRRQLDESRFDKS